MPLVCLAFHGSVHRVLSYSSITTPSTVSHRFSTASLPQPCLSNRTTCPISKRTRVCHTSPRVLSPRARCRMDAAPCATQICFATPFSFSWRRREEIYDEERLPALPLWCRMCVSIAINQFPLTCLRGNVLDVPNSFVLCWCVDQRVDKMQRRGGLKCTWSFF